MAKNGKVKVGIIGSQFAADLHAAAFLRSTDEAELLAIASPTKGNAAALAEKHSIPRVFLDYRDMLKESDIELVTIAAPNYLHARMALDCAQAGKHIVSEKPLAMTIEEGEGMVDGATRHGVLLMYAEELLFAPKYARAKQMADAAAFGKIHLIKQTEMHSGPHSSWFWDVDRSGGGAFMDLGCHGIAFCHWFLGRPAIKSIYCQMGTSVHADKTLGEDNSLCILEFADGAVGLVENSWARRGGMDRRANGCTRWTERVKGCATKRGGNMGKAILRLRWLLLGLLVGLSGLAWAQDTATFTGSVRDKSGAVLPGADIIIKNTATGTIREVKSNSAGEYVAAALAPGQYNITVTVAGLKKYRRHYYRQRGTPTAIEWAQFHAVDHTRARGKQSDWTR